ncbi:MAG: magnesium/cobalt transporter CorA [Candidatus Micrarchaeaceae archaeon]
MVRVLYRDRDGHTRFDLATEEFPQALKDTQSLLWVDFQGEPPETCEPILCGTFGFHPLAVDDALQESHVPKVDDWGQYLYIVLHAVRFQGKDDITARVDTLELDLFLGRNYLVTHHDHPIPAVDRLWVSVQRDERPLRRGADYLAYRLADEVVADYMPAIEEMEVAIDEIEDQVFGNPQPRTVERIFALKRALLHLRRIVMPQREVLNRLARGDFPVIDAESRPFFRDIYDHLVRLNDINESMRDLISGAMDIYLSVINNRMNEVMKTLTIIATLFMPLSFIAGFFGMNFFQPVADSMKVWTGEAVLWATITLMFLSPLAMLFWAWRRGWL